MLNALIRIASTKNLLIASDRSPRPFSLTMQGLFSYQPFTKLNHKDGHSSAISAVKFSPDGHFIASAGLDGRICIWNVYGSKLMYVFIGKSPVLSLLWAAPSNSHLVCGMEDGTIASLTISNVSRLCDPIHTWPLLLHFRHISIWMDFWRTATPSSVSR